MPQTTREAAPAELDDLTLARAQRGDESACRALVRRYERPVFAMISRMCGRDRVEDLAQETFLRVFTALPRFESAGPARLSTWILTIATRLALDELRRRPLRTTPLDDRMVDRLPGSARADEGAERRSLRLALQRAVAELSPEQRAVVLLREVHGLDYDEIGRALEIDLGTVKSRLHRARAALRAALEFHHD
jgi:RNA polymerase sigma-70 factor (ECF subfamily)